jgi:Protein of unknown function (DUF2934)
MSNTPAVSPQQQTRAQAQAEPNRDQIQERAYFRYVERGRVDGRALDDWLAAETEIGRKANTRSES